MSEARQDPTLDAIGQGLAAQEAIYLRRQRLADGPHAHAAQFAADLAGQIRAGHSDTVLAAFVNWAVARKAGLKNLVLLVAGLLALGQRDWGSAEALGREVVGRDHHDLLAQRLIDAARERSDTLETETDRWLKTRLCRAPFREMESRTTGDVHFCCSAWQPVPIGRLDTPGADGFWNSERAQEIRRSVLDGDYSHCSRWHCPSIAGRRLPERKPDEPRPPLRVEEGPERVILSHDRSCNISCPSCRTELINLPHKETERLNGIFEKHLQPIVSGAKSIKVTGSGDPFGSRHFRHILGRLTSGGAEGRRIQLHTNGLLANERAWNDLNLWDQVSSVWVSVDAARAETYSVLRRGGNFDTLTKNLRFLGELNRRGAIDTFRLDFVVQQANFQEMSDFVDLARDAGADGVYFLRLRNWGHVTPADFRRQDICSPDHPEHAQLLDILADDRFVSGAVQPGSLTPLINEARRRAGRV
ncbi:MAG: radical SAM protein [Proteobacteria bacterium]|nr:radical SAM protein [Pseudomonadota bacterium]